MNRHILGTCVLILTEKENYQNKKNEGPPKSFRACVSKILKKLFLFLRQILLSEKQFLSCQKKFKMTLFYSKEITVECMVG